MFPFYQPFNYPQKQKIIINNDNGKVSLSKSFSGCSQCLKFKKNIKELNKQVYHLNKQLQKSQRKQQEMQILCSQIEKTKNKLANKIIANKDSRQISERQTEKRINDRIKTEKKGRYRQGLNFIDEVQLSLLQSGKKSSQYRPRQENTERTIKMNSNFRNAF